MNPTPERRGKCRGALVWGSTGKWKSCQRHRSLFVDILAVSGSNHQDHQPVILDLADDTVVRHAIAPEFVQLTLQGLAQLARMLQRHHPFLQIGTNATAVLRIDRKSARLNSSLVRF